MLPSTTVHSLICLFSLTTVTTAIATGRYRNCTGSEDGDAYGVLACITTDWVADDRATITLDVTDTKSQESHAVYGYDKVYYHDHIDKSDELWLDLGQEKGFANAETADGNGNDITGVRVWGCVQTFWGHSCSKGDFVSHGVP